MTLPFPEVNVST